MVHSIISLQVQQDKFEEARDWAKRMAKRMKEAFGVDMETMLPTTPGEGEGGRIYWLSTHDSFAAWADFHTKELEDPERRKLVKESQTEHYFVRNTLKRSLYRVF